MYDLAWEQLGSNSSARALREFARDYPASPYRGRALDMALEKDFELPVVRNVKIGKSNKDQRWALNASNPKNVGFRGKNNI